MTKLLIEANRQGYSTKQCGETMTAEQLIEMLQELDPQTPIYISNDNGYTYGSIDYDDIREEELEDEE